MTKLLSRRGAIGSSFKVLPPPPTGTLIWNGDLDTGNESQWSGIIRNATDRWRVTPAADGVTPRQGSHMARVECKQGEASSWASTLSATLALAAGLPIGVDQTYTDIYLAWSAYIPSNWPWQSGSQYGMHSIFIEWHGAGGGTAVMSQAPFHWGIYWTTGRFFINFFRAIGGYTPLFEQQFELLSDPGMANAWHDYTCRFKWSSGSDGVITFWRDGTQLYNYNGPNSPLSGERLKFQGGIYCANNAPTSKVIYLDEMKLGTSYAIVQPG